MPLPDFPFFSLPKELHSLLEKLTPVPLHKNKQHNQRNDIRHIHPHLARELHAFSLICLLEEILKSPSIPAGTEHQVNETSEWKQVVADDEILEIQHVAALSERHETTPEIETQHARKRQDRNYHQIDADCLFDRTASQIRCKGYDILEYRGRYLNTQSIINYVNLLKQEKFDDPKIQRYIEVLEEKSQRLKTLTEDVVEASKVSSGNISLEFMNINMIELIQQTSGEFEEKFQTRNLTQIMNFPEEDAIVRVDGRRMWRVLANIYNNAAKYAMEGTRIYADLQTLDGKVIFSLKNISEQPLNISSAEELTERFIRGDLSRSTEGSGLGLSIAKTLTTMMGGTFDLYLDGDLFKVVIIFDKID